MNKTGNIFLTVHLPHIHMQEKKVCFGFNSIMIWDFQQSFFFFFFCQRMCFQNSPVD